MLSALNFLKYDYQWQSFSINNIMELQDHGEEFSGYTTTAKLSVSSTKLSFDMIIEIVKLIKEEDLWNQILRLLFLDVWSLITNVNQGYSRN